MAKLDPNMMAVQNAATTRAMTRVRLPNLFEGVRVEWVTGGGFSGRGTIVAVYSDATIDVESDSGSKFDSWSFATVQRESR